MTRHSLQSALCAGIPFVMNMADGKHYEVHAWEIAIGRTRVVVLDDRDRRPMLTMIGISCFPKQNGPK